MQSRSLSAAGIVPALRQPLASQLVLFGARYAIVIAFVLLLIGMSFASPYLFFVIQPPQCRATGGADPDGRRRHDVHHGDRRDRPVGRFGRGADVGALRRPACSRRADPARRFAHAVAGRLRRTDQRHLRRARHAIVRRHAGKPHLRARVRIHLQPGVRHRRCQPRVQDARARLGRSASHLRHDSTAHRRRRPHPAAAYSPRPLHAGRRRPRGGGAFAGYPYRTRQAVRLY